MTGVVRTAQVTSLAVVLLLPASALAQVADRPAPGLPATALGAPPGQAGGVPRQVQYTGTIPGAQGSVALTFAIYTDQEGGAPLWVEIHPVILDRTGRYSVWLGSLNGGLPMHLFQSGEARWLGVRADALLEQPRVRFLSVPYALKAGDADTLGGLPLSAFVLSAGARQALKAEMSVLGRPLGTGQPGFLTGGGGWPIIDRDVPRRDQVIPEDLIVQGSACAGLDCVNNENFGFDTIRLKENNLRIHFDDTSAQAGFPANDWRLIANDSANGGANKFSIEDSTGAKTPFTITAGASTNSIFVDSIGRVGFRTSTPVLDLHASTNNTPAIRLEQNNSGGFSAQTWDVAGNEANFFVRDVTSGSRLPLRIRPGAPTSSLDIDRDGNVGVGTEGPTQRLDVRGNIAIPHTQTIGAGLGFGCTTCAGTSTIELFNGATGNLTLQSTAAFKLLLNPGGGNVGVGNASPLHPLHMGSGAHVTAGGVWTNASSRALKDRIEALSIEDAATALDALQPVTFVYKRDPGERQVGFIAEDVPDLVATNDRTSLAPMDLVAVLTRVVQEQRDTIRALASLGQSQQRTVDAMASRLADLERRLAELEAGRNR